MSPLMVRQHHILEFACAAFLNSCLTTIHGSAILNKVILFQKKRSFCQILNEQRKCALCFTMKLNFYTCFEACFDKLYFIGEQAWDTPDEEDLPEGKFRQFLIYLYVLLNL